MFQNTINILKKRENLYIFILFVCFFPLKTQTQNLVSIIFDHLFRHGVTGEVFTYNYTGLLIGCDNVAEMLRREPNFNRFQKHGIFYAQFLPSLIAFIYLFFRWKRNLTFKLLDWFLLIVSSFSIFWALNTGLLVFIRDELFSARFNRIIPIALFFYAIGGVIFFKIFNFKERVQTIFIGIPAFWKSLLLWYGYLGPILLPIAE